MVFPDPSRGLSDEHSPAQIGQSWAQRRRDKIAAEIARNRRGEYSVPTWVLAVLLALIVGAWLALVLLS